MDPRCYRGSYNSGYGIGFPPSYADHHAFGQYPTYQDPPPDPTPALPTQLEYVWDIRNNSRQTPISPPVVPFIGPVSPRGSEGDCSFASAQPAVGFYPAQPQVSLSAGSIIGSAGVMSSSTPGHHTPRGQHNPPLWTLGSQLKTGQIPEPTMALPHAN